MSSAHFIIGANGEIIAVKEPDYVPLHPERDLEQLAKEPTLYVTQSEYDNIYSKIDTKLRQQVLRGFRYIHITDKMPRMPELPQE